MGETKMDNKIWKEVFGDWGKIIARESYQESIICGVCGNDKSKTPRNKAGNYTKPGMRKKIFNRIKAQASHGTGAGKWSARKAQALAKAYKKAGGGYK